MKDLGSAKRILGMKIVRNRPKLELRLIQTVYILEVPKINFVCLVLNPLVHLYLKQMKNFDIWKRFHMLILLNLVVYTGFDLAYSIGVLSRCISNPKKKHWEALKWALKQLRRTLDLGLTFKQCSERIKLKGYIDADYASDRDTRKSVTSYVFNIYDGCVSYKSQLQHSGFIYNGI